MASYSAVNHPYGDPHYSESSAGFITPGPAAKKRGLSPWIKFGLPILVLVIAGAVVGVVLGLRNSNKDDNKSTSSASGEAAVSAKLEIGIFPTETNSEFMVPIYPSTTNSAAFTSPTFSESSNLAWPEDSFQPSNPSPTSVRPDRPRIIAPASKWAALPSLIEQEPYLKSWNDTIFGNATEYSNRPAVVYNMDGDSGILDNAREVKMRIKAFSYVYRMTNDTKWADLVWRELANAAGQGTTSFGPDGDDKWNPTHFLDVAEFSSAFGIAYDWLHDVWTDEQKTQIRENLIRYGLSLGAIAYDDQNELSGTYGWWRNDVNGNWNCVCNGGLTVASLAILGDDTTGTAEQLLGLTIDNAKANCAQGVSTDGTWSETPNYWYFGSTGHAEMASSLLTATGSDFGFLDANPDFQKTGDSHMYGSGPGSLFDYGDHGPNKFSATANGLFFYASHWDIPRYALYQRDQRDAAEPWSMFWYNPSVNGAFWEGATLDGFFDDDLDQWVSMRSSWTDQDALYVAMKAGRNQGHQAHNDLDVGDFVLDCLGTRWAGEFGSGDYLSTNYFTSDAQDADRWKYYRKMTEGQNTIVVNGANQLVTAAPTIKHDSSGTTQGASTVFEVPDDSTAYWTTDMTSAYNDVTSMKRGVRMLNKRRQVLIQDEINASQSVLWQMHTNATVTIDEATGQTATLERDGKTMIITIVNPPSGDVKFNTAPSQRMESDVTPPVPDQENPGITALQISLGAGEYTLMVLFNPQWEGMASDEFVTPSSVALDAWTLESHQ